MKFIPETEETKIQVPYYSEVLGRSEEGWTGHNTNRTVEEFKSEISAALGRLGAMVTGFQRGWFADEDTGIKRQAIVIHYTVSNERGELWPGKIDVAALPVNRKRCQNEQSYDNKMDKALRMALYMALTALQGAWNMRVLSPGYAPLMPWMLTPDGATFSEAFEISLSLDGISGLLPEPEIDGTIEAIEGEFTEAKD
jgi:hypothetical protein